MKLDTKTNKYATNVVAENHGHFKVSNNAVMQQVLSTFLYSDKIKAVIRELSINAWESHLVAGHPEKPFDVNLPTTNNYQFSIRDYGIGLSKEDLTQLYCTYGVSTKRHSNDFVGCMGIGSKSVWCYTDMFSVISYFNGVKYVVSNSKDSHGRFCFDILSEEDTDEPNGLEIIFDVNRADTHAFQSKAELVYRHFYTAPNCNVKLAINKPSVISSSNNWEILSSGYDTQLIMGQVAYPIDSSQFNGTVKRVLNHYSAINIIADIGDVSITPAREALQYTKNTVDFITEVCDDIISTVKKDIAKGFKNCKSKWEARIKLLDYTGNGLLRLVNGNDSWDYNGDTILYRTHWDNPLQDKPIHSYKYENHTSSTKESKKGVRIGISHNTRIAVYESGGYAGARRYINKKTKLALYIIPPELKDYVVNDLGYPEKDFLKVSSFPAAVRQARGKTVDNLIQGYRFNLTANQGFFYSYSYRNPSRFWQQDAIDLDKESGYYGLLKEYCLMDPTGRFSGANIRNIRDYLDGKNVNLIGNLYHRKGKLENHKNWKPLSDYFKEELDKVSKQPWMKYVGIDSPSSELEALCSISTHLKSDTDLYKKLLEIADYKKAKDKANEYDTLWKMYKALSGVEYTSSVTKANLKFDLTSKYPLLRHIPCHAYRHQEVIDYINSI